MPAAVAVPLITTAVSTGAQLYSAGQQRSANNDAIDQQKALADRLFYMGMPAYGKKAKQGLFDLLGPQLQQVLSGQTQQVISPDLQNQQYAQLLKTFQEPYQQGRAGLEQGFSNRGLDYGNIASKALGQYDQRSADTLAKAGTDIAMNAARLNYGAGQDQYNRLLNTYLNLFTQGNNQKMAQMGLGVQGQQQAIGAQAANSGNYWSSMASAVGNLAGSIPWDQILRSRGLAGVPGLQDGAVLGTMPN